MNIPSYSNLINRKVVIPSPSTPYTAVENFFLHEIMKDRLSLIDVDENFYFEEYPDIRDAVASGLVADAKSHYIRFGYYEHRLPHEVKVDEEWYLQAYADVRDAVAKGTFADAATHFRRSGFREGRSPSANFAFRLIDDPKPAAAPAKAAGT